jgi:hypothetical protein
MSWSVNLRLKINLLGYFVCISVYLSLLAYDIPKSQIWVQFCHIDPFFRMLLTEGRSGCWSTTNCHLETCYFVLKNRRNPPRHNISLHLTPLSPSFHRRIQPVFMHKSLSEITAEILLRGVWCRQWTIKFWNKWKTSLFYLVRLILKLLCSGHSYTVF